MVRVVRRGRSERLQASKLSKQANDLREEEEEEECEDGGKTKEDEKEGNLTQLI